MSVTFKQLETEVRRLAAANPEYRYPAELEDTCVYNETDNLPACIFGKAFANLGHPVPEKFEGSSISVVIRGLGVLVSYEDLRWAERVQGFQDAGFPWGKCIDVADHWRATDV